MFYQISALNFNSYPASNCFTIFIRINQREDESNWQNIILIPRIAFFKKINQRKTYLSPPTYR